MSLQNLQAEFADILTSDDLNTDIVQPNRQLIIHKNNAISSLIKTMTETYPLIARLLGADFFCQTVKEYVRHYPSHSGNLHDYGEYFRDFLAAYLPVKHLMYLPEVADFEWNYHVVQFAPEHAPLNMTALQNIAPAEYDDLRFILHPACVVKKFQYPILKIIEFCEQDSDHTLDVNTGGMCLLIIRRDFDMKLEPLDADDYACLHAIAENQSLAQAFAAATIVNPNYKLDEKLPVWVQNKTIVDVYNLC